MVIEDQRVWTRGAGARCGPNTGYKVKDVVFLSSEEECDVKIHGMGSSVPLVQDDSWCRDVGQPHACL